MTELNLDGIIGPTHHFGGLGFGNLASMESVHRPSHPRDAALQGLYKMKLLSDMGLKQAVLPPHERPDMRTLRALGFVGSDEQVIEQAFKESPTLASACYSASSAWVANAATVTPSADSYDGRVHFTPANLASHFHRSIESYTASCALMGIFSDPESFVHHDPLPSHPDLGDEGSANTIRFCDQYISRGVRLFVHDGKTKKFPARQSLEASKAIARQHRLYPELVFYAEQNPEAIDAGIFHNDLIALGNQNVLIYHEKAWTEHEHLIDKLQDTIDLHPILISNEALSLKDLTDSYLLNSQLVTLPDGQMALIAPTESRNHPKAQETLQAILEGNNPISKVLYFNLSESMKNGGGPACLRLQVVLTDTELGDMNQAVLLDDILYHTLVDWVNDHYREELNIQDLADPSLLLETRTALDELTEILDLGPLYPFQQG